MPESTTLWYDYSTLATALAIDERLIRQYVAEGFFPQPVPLSKKKNVFPASWIPHLIWMLSIRDRFRKESLPDEEA